MSLKAAVKKWTGGNASREYYRGVERATGLSGDDRLSAEMLAGPVGLQLVKAMSRFEAGRDYPLSDTDWAAAQALAFRSREAIDAAVARREAGQARQASAAEQPSAELANIEAHARSGSPAGGSPAGSSAAAVASAAEAEPVGSTGRPAWMTPAAAETRPAGGFPPWAQTALFRDSLPIGGDFSQQPADVSTPPQTSAQRAAVAVPKVTPKVAAGLHRINQSLGAIFGVPLQWSDDPALQNDAATLHGVDRLNPGYVPGERESENVEDRRNEDFSDDPQMDMLRRVQRGEDPKAVIDDWFNRKLQELQRRGRETAPKIQLREFIDEAERRAEEYKRGQRR
jgi:hypothetical protein